MKEYKVPIQSLIDHIKTSLDVDPWAKEMAEELLKEQKQIVRCKDCKHYDSFTQSCLDGLDGIFTPDWFCADGQEKEKDTKHPDL